MPIHKAETQINTLYLGNKPIVRAYKGTEIIYNSVLTENIYVFNTEFMQDDAKTIILQNELRGDTSTNVITDWGDGTKDTSLTHTYAEDGTYTVRTKYGINTINYGTDGIQTYIVTTPDCNGDTNTRNALISVLGINSKQNTLKNMFYECTYLSTIDVSEPKNWNFKNIKSLESMFKNCSSIELFDINQWDLSTVENIAGMFGESTITAKKPDTSEGYTISYDPDTTEILESFTVSGSSYYKILEEVPENKYLQGSGVIYFYNTDSPDLQSYEFDVGTFTYDQDHFEKMYCTIKTNGNAGDNLLTITTTGWYPNAGVKFTPGVWVSPYYNGENPRYFVSITFNGDGEDDWIGTPYS